MKFQARQGDVLIEQIPAPVIAGTLASDEVPMKVADGERTGHSHRLIAVEARADGGPAAQLFDGPDGRFVLLAQACELTHEEHAPILLAPGAYRVTLQREYEPGGVKNVAD